MKHLWMIIGFLLLCGPAFTQDFIVTSAEYIVVSGNVSDTLGRTRLTPDSIRIVVTDSAGTELSDAWFESADAQAVLNGDIITFFDQWNDINGAASVGTFSLMVTIASDAQNNIDLFSNQNYTIRGVTVGVEAMHSDVAGLDGWAPIHDNDSIIVDQSTLEDMTVATVTTVTGGATSAAQTIMRDTLDALIDTAASHDDWGSKEASLFDPANDSVIVDESELASATITTVTTATNVTNVNDKTGYSLSQAFPTNFADMAITVTTGIVTADVASIQASTITSTSIATDAITSDGLAASAVNEIVDSTWDEILTGATHNIATSAGKRLRDVSHIIIAEGTAQRGNSLGIVLASATSFADNIINGNIISIIGGTGEGQSKHIHDFTGATDSITLHDGDEWTTNPDNTSEYIINPAAQTSVIHIDDSAKADIADAVWDALVASHTTALTYGDTLPEMLRLIQDTTESQDDWVAKEASLFDPTSDSVLVDESTIADVLFDPATDSVIVDESELASATIATVTNGVSILTNDAKVIAGFSKDSTALVVAAEHDSTLWWLGLGIGAKSRTDYAAEEDTIWVITPAGDSLAFIRLYHPGGSAGDAPDSTLGVIAP